MFEIVSHLKKSLRKTRSSFTDQIKSLFSKTTAIDDSLFQDLEELLIKADINVNICMDILEKVSERKKNFQGKVYDIYDFIRDEMKNYLPHPIKDDECTVLLVLGVNGSGKTTSVAKLAHWYKSNGKSVLISAADTFRVSAVQQLKIWANRLQIPIVSKAEGSDPSAVVYESMEIMKSRKNNLLIIDTAGRLHTKKNLMDELNKIKRTIQKHFPTAKIKTRLVLDSTNGNNGLNQAKQFHKDVGIDDLLLSKMDSSAKGGFVFSIQNELNIPVSYIGYGEKIDDLVGFSQQKFLQALFE